MCLMDSRPILNNTISLKDFKEFYWLKNELISFCKAEKLKTSGSKTVLASRIEIYIKTGKREDIEVPKRLKACSTFDWKKAILSLDTIITENYSNTENVRKFFIAEIGPHFKFNVKFMNWLKSNSGKTLKDAVEVWCAIKLASKRQTGPKEIAPQFEYNRYLRDFLADNPNLSRKDGIKSWNRKKRLRGSNVYAKTDLLNINGPDVDNNY